MAAAAKTLLGGFGLLLLAGLVLYLALAAILYFRQAALLYYPGMPGRELRTDPASADMLFDDLVLETGDGERLHAWWVPAEKRRGTLLFMHGNAGNISHRIESIRIFHELGLDVLIFDYRGYGRSTGRPGEKGTYRDAAAAWQYLVDELGRDPRELVLFGRSLGAAVAVQLAARRACGGLIVESGFTSIPDLAAHHYPFLPVRLLSRFTYPSLKRMPEVGCPVLVIHARDDEIVPFGQGERLYAAARGPKDFLALQGGHNAAFLIERQRYVEAVHRFLDAHLAADGGGP